ncbi:MAG: sigma-70 family RNA polymerase sigma factor [Anaerolineae bacterium]|nr:sigma-70 family RNA polymerase sigma factor [Anaerolineae bacterium]
MLSDIQLLTQLQAGDDASFEALFRRYYHRVYNILYRLLGNRDDAEDAAQQVFLKLYHSPRHIRRQGHELNLAGWLYRVAVNTGYNSLRRRRRRQDWQERFGRWGLFEPSAPDPADIAAGHEERARVRRVLAQMDPRQAKLLLLRHSGLSYQELAVALNLAPGSIGSLLTRAERAFAKKYRLAYPPQDEE